LGGAVPRLGQEESIMSGEIEARLAKLGLTLPPAPAAVANYVPYLLVDDLLFVSGQLARAADGSVTVGRLGADMTPEAGAAAARLCALNVLAQANAAAGGLERIAQVVKLTGFVNATPEFTDQPRVVNGASDLMVEVLGDKGRHTRAAVGVASLPMGSAVEVDAILRIARA
jgi:enamine deaminase RidA (YjgF/YER057c/UK114 family)